MNKSYRFFCAVPALLLAIASTVGAQTADHVLLVVNKTSQDSVKVGEHYSRVRRIPADQVLQIEAPVTETVPRATFQRQIETPISNWIAKRAAHDRILYIVLTKGVPLRIEGTLGRTGTVASVDSELTLLYRKMVGATLAPGGQVPNPYYLGAEPATKAKRFNHRDHDIYLVTRLDGYTAADVIAMIDRGVAAAPAGNVVLDQKAELPASAAENWMKDAAVALNDQGFGEQTVLEGTTRAFDGTQPVIGYYSWGSNDPVLRTRKLSVNFAPGAIAAMFLSSDARTFAEPPAAWVAGDSRNPRNLYAGSSQSLTGDLIRNGVSGAAGYVMEPYADGAVRPDKLFPAYLAGFNLAEAFYLATPYLSWQSVIVGDPLCSPFATRKAGTEPAVVPAIEPTTELPEFFAARRLQSLERSGQNPEALRLFLKGDARIAAGNKVGAREPLQAAVALVPNMVRAHHLLGALYLEAEERDQAIATYKTILDHDRNDVIALNNLSYSLAVHKNDPVTALPLARRAFDLLKTIDTGDTLGWIMHLTGDSAGASVIYAQIVRAQITNPEILLHAATVFAAAGRPDAAAKELARAVALDASYETRDDVKSLRARIGRAANNGS
jgi:uncharacterized protein (TIGR03790 family)